MPPRSSTTRQKLDASHRVVIMRGPDPFLRTASTRQLVEGLETANGEIEVFTYDGVTVEAAVILDELRSFGLLQPHKLVIVDNADKLLAPPKTEAARAAPRGARAPMTTRALFEKYAEAPVESATLLLRADTWRPGKLDKIVVKHGAIVECKTPNERTAVTWCVRRADAHGVTIDHAAATQLVDRIGPELARLDMELGKLAAFVAERGHIDTAAVREMVGPSREEQSWAIQAALLSGSTGEAVGKLRELLRIARQPEALITWAIIDLVRKLHAAAHLVRDGMPAAGIARELKLWDVARTAVPAAASAHPPETFARLLQLAIDSDAGSKTGLGDPQRSLEALVVQVADMMRRA